MKNKLTYSFDEDLKERLKDPKFKKVWDQSEAEYLLAKVLIEARLKKRMSQRDLAKKAKTTQAAISRVECMSANPSLFFLQRLARALDTKFQITIQ